jgi:hypothetical protein
MLERHARQEHDLVVFVQDFQRQFSVSRQVRCKGRQAGGACRPVLLRHNDHGWR